MKRSLSLVWLVMIFFSPLKICAGAPLSYEVIDRFHEEFFYSSASLVLGSDGRFWGTGSGGTFASGAIYKVDDAGKLETVAEFTGRSGPRRGKNPQATLLLASDGNFYGMTLSGGLHDAGTIYRLTPAGVLTTLVDFTGNTGAAQGFGNTGPLAEGTDGNLYGTCTLTVGEGNGGVFRMTPGGSYALLAMFTGASGALPGSQPSTGRNTGSSPSGGLVKGNDGHLYGTTNSGGSAGHGTFFRVSAEGTITVLHHFEGRTGRTPLVGGDNGNFYGSADNSIYRITPAGDFTELVPYQYLSGGHSVQVELPSKPIGALVSDGQGGLIGTAGRTTSVEASIFTFSGGVLSILDYYPKISGKVYSPRSGLFRTPSGKVIGVATALDRGILIELQKTPTTKIAPFVSAGDVYAENPLSGPVLARDGNLYGLCDSGVYRVVPDRRISLHATLPYAGFEYQFSRRLFAGKDGNFYGCTPSDGSVQGYLYRIAPEGTVTKLHLFAEANDYSRPDLIHSPGDGLIEDSAGNLYGTTLDGGADGSGTVFRLATDGTFTLLAEFKGGTTGPARGFSPKTALLLASDGNLYGTTRAGGAKNGGVVFRLTANGELTTLADFPAPTRGASDAFNLFGVSAALVEGPDGNLYGVSEHGGIAGKNFYGEPDQWGTLFRVTKAGEFTTLVKFSGDAAGPRGAHPNNLLLGLDGALYGTCAGGAELFDSYHTNIRNEGTIFRYSLDGLFTSLEFGDFPDETAGTPLPGLVMDGAGSIYGTARRGFSDKYAQPIFKVTPGNSASAMTVVAMKGGAVPGEPDGTRYAAFGPVTDGPFSGTLEFAGKKSAALFAVDGSVRVRVGGSAPGLDGTFIAKLGVPNGDAAIATLKPGVGDVTATTDTLLLAGLRSGALRVAAREGVALDGLPGVSVKTFGSFDGQGDVIFFLATLQGTGVTPLSDSALCAALADGSVRVLLREGDRVDGHTVSIMSTLVAYKGTLAEGRWRGGTNAIGARLTFEDKSQALYTLEAGTTPNRIRWAGTGDVLAGGALAGTKIATLGVPGFGSDGPAYASTLALQPDQVTAENDGVLFRSDASGLLLLARENAHPLIRTFGEPVSGLGGRLAFTGKIWPLYLPPGSGVGVCYADDGAQFRIIAQRGTPAVGGGFWDSFVSLVLPEGPASGPIFTAKLAVKKADGVTAAHSFGLWAVDGSGQLRRLLRAGDRMLIGGAPRTLKTFTALTGSSGSLGAASGYDADSVTVMATFADKTQALIRLAIP